jgi:hypothetical protein
VCVKNLERIGIFWFSLVTIEKNEQEEAPLLNCLGKAIIIEPKGMDKSFIDVNLM